MYKYTLGHHRNLLAIQVFLRMASSTLTESGIFGDSFEMWALYAGQSGPQHQSVPSDSADATYCCHAMIPAQPYLNSEPSHPAAQPAPYRPANQPLIIAPATDAIQIFQKCVRMTMTQIRGGQLIWASKALLDLSKWTVENALRLGITSFSPTG
jgi:hypothetical protein